MPRPKSQAKPARGTRDGCFYRRDVPMRALAEFK
ncbi:MAG: hypothetical protein HDKAJFGB_00416 [Anaerolineae bacterium]|nr:hypothetical protein [Anaerolineae bacterium]